MTRRVGPHSPLLEHSTYEERDSDDVFDHYRVAGHVRDEVNRACERDRWWREEAGEFWASEGRWREWDEVIWTMGAIRRPDGAVCGTIPEEAGGDEMEEKELYTTEEVATWLRLAPQTLRAWRCRGVGPTYVAIGGRILYRHEDLQAFVERCRVDPEVAP